MTAPVRWTLAGFLVTSVTLYVALQLGGAAPEPPPPGIPDPGPFTGWAIPAVKVVSDLAGLVTVGFLTTAAFLLPSSAREVQGLSARAVRRAAVAALVWAAAALVLFALNAAATLLIGVDELSWSVLTQFFDGSSLGWALVAQAVIALLVAVLARRTFSVRATALLLGLALGGFVPQALSGHAAGSGSHDLAVVSMLLHLAGAALWVGGLAGLAWIALRGSRRLPAGVSRFSTLALWCVVIIGISGVVNAATRLQDLGDLDSQYALLVWAKVAAFVVLAMIGLLHRRRTVVALERSGGLVEDGPAQGRARYLFLRVAAVELLVMGMTVAVAVALSRTPTPRPADLYQSPAEAILGGALPPAPTLWHLVWGFTANGVGLAVVGLGLALYVAGLRVMRRRGDTWPLGRTIAWMSGLLMVAWATFGGLGVYSHVLFSAHMVSHMVLSMVAPILLVLGAPVTLALRTLPGPRQKGDVSPRAMLVSLLHSRFVSVVTFPLFAAAIFVGSLYGLYFTPIFENAMESHIGHGLMELHFLAAGALFYYVIIGVDPSPRRLAPLWRFVILLVTIPFHAFFSIALMAMTTVVAGGYYTSLDRPYATDLLEDQYLGGGIAWAMGEVPLVLVMGALFVQWFRSDAREAVRHDRSANQNDDADLTAYNAYLAQLAEQRPRRGPGERTEETAGARTDPKADRAPDR
ncbi:cytochrome c oxidase assembly protein [Mumia sp. zg.B53]|uniref:cytochrome c oxidase assembly protein n=1 Tax=unclassified Mumia TaxID=2621872 RepID=UPI001C6E4857|nr:MULTISPECIES: cytochrome c oxidase assembly protein [unclassified Mumia]MBW9204998.1 cytochrome c oxidase assembly protein [Mumia sp. zg.B17]MBW9213608.1 cytochrome c oxidase assembly protein [Mumia sp. zg.B53]MDD9347488.1 cytochrome c oxidase assembly protein [Mumia sp.]